MLTYPSQLIERGYLRLGAILGIAENVRGPHMIDAMVFSFLLANVGGILWVESHPPTQWLSIVALWFAIWRIVDIVCTAGRMVLFDPYKTRYSSEYKISSTVRSIILGFINYIELILGFAVIYRVHVEQIGPPNVVHEGQSALYLSAVTQLTVGYGDLQPMGNLRLVAGLQAFFGLALLSLFVARYISLLRPISEIEEEAEA